MPSSSSSPFSLDLLKEALQSAKQEEKDPAADPTSGDTSLDAIWKQVAAVPRQPMDATLFRCPLSPTPIWAFAEWESLPRHIQQDELLRRRHGDDDTNTNLAHGRIVQVSNLYEAVNSTGQTGQLSEYTRGLAGRVRPFRPGGLDPVPAASDDQEELLQQQERELSRRILSQSTEENWKQGLLLTAPPSHIVDFQVGLSWEDVHGNKVEASSKPVEPVPDPDNNESLPIAASASAPTLFSNRGFAILDDDSLFGSSSSSSSSDDDDESSDDNDDQEEEDDEDDDDERAPPETKQQRHETKIQLKEAPSSTAATSPKDYDHDGGGEQDIDGLLQELSAPDHARSSSAAAAHPLKLAASQAALATASHRKSWASTRLLPIADWDTYLPQPALKFPFVLDTFQQQAIARLERNESVFVAAHTSAGKTVVAEYAVALARQRATRCVYTSPIKALSNQKFRDFAQKFGKENVGLITGDLQVNVDDSTVLIMTTEILRSMLYRGADLIRDIEFVIFDEVHYINDSERGVVWEEVIIMLPHQVNMVFLSATTPNTLDFSDWIGRTKRRLVHVVTTNYRPVPLSHFLWAGNELHLILRGNGGFLDKGYSEATNALIAPSKKKKKGETAKPANRPTGSKHMAWQAAGTKNHWMSLVRYLDRELLTPSVIFSFSKKKCEEIAEMLRSLDLNTAAERSAVQGFTLQAVARLNRADANLPQVKTICEMATRGIGVHHGGLLPILKEMVEILFSRNLIKVLMATETFAMGVNMPAKAVVFNSLRKHDGTQFRQLEPGEYTQMAGRAGRRGLDDVGTVIIACFGEAPPPNAMLKMILTGRSTLLKSQFRLTYNMILNLLRVEDMSVESMIKRSFSEFATQRALTTKEYPQLLARGTKTLEKLTQQVAGEVRHGAEDIEDYFRVCRDLLSTTSNVLDYLVDNDSVASDEVLKPGRVLLVSAARRYGVVRAPAIVLRSTSADSSMGVKKSANASGPKTIVGLILLPPSYVLPTGEGTGDSQAPGTVGYVGTSNQRYYTIREIDLNQILVLSDLKHKIDVKSLLKQGGRGLSTDNFFSKAPPVRADPFFGMKTLGKKSQNAGPKGQVKEKDTIDEVMTLLIQAETSESASGMSPLDLQSFVKRGNEVVSLRQACEGIDELIMFMRTFQSHRHPNLERWYKDIERRETLREQVELLQHALSNESLSLFPDFLQRKAVLKELGFVNSNDTVSVKGRVACEVNTCEELIVSEMVFDGILNDMAPEEIAACLSALVFQEKRTDESSYIDSTELPARLIECCNEMKSIALRLGEVQKRNGLPIDPAEYCEKSLKFGLVHVVYEWACGISFESICMLTDVQEGSIVRSITRLDELCREVRNCARVVGNPTLYRKMEAAGEAIKRDIVFASSLYVS